MVSTFILYFFAAIILIQISYLMALLSGILIAKKKQPAKSDPVSVVVAAHNEYENLQILLPKLLDQDHHTFEIIVVDDRSVDETITLSNDVRFRDVRFVKIDSTPEGINSKKYALSTGIKQAKNPVVLLTDADCYPVSSKWISSMASGFSAQKNIVLGFSDYESRGSFLHTFIRFETLLVGLHFIGWANLGFPYMGVGRNMGYTKSFFSKKNGFSDFKSLVGGDDDLFINANATSANATTIVGKDALVLSKPKNSYKEYFRQKLRHLSIGRYYKVRDKLLLGIYSVTQFLSWLLFAIILLGYSELSLITLGFFFTRFVILVIVLAVVSRRFGHSFNVALVPILDLCYTFYYIFVGSAALIVRKVRWT